MPYRWTEPDGPDAAEALHLWPHRSMTNTGLGVFMGASFALACLPLLAVLGSPVMWGILPFAMGALGLTLYMIRVNDRALLLSEELTLSDERVALVRRDPRRPERRWEANPYWVQVAMREETGPVPNYVTLRGGDREVEIGAFLSPEERLDLFDDLSRRLGAGRGALPPRP